MNTEGHLITGVAAGSIGEQMEIVPGDRLLTINGHQVEDIFDYEYQVDSASFVMEVLKENGEEWELEIENQYEDPGLTFENGLMSDYRSCRNKCIFCFIDQMPGGMRDTLYFKDDDSRLSFLQGNYITLTNLSSHDVERIIKFKLSPVNISVHTTNPNLRCQMLNNRFAGESLGILDQLAKAETPMNGQIVLCKGINDRAELDRTIQDLMKYLPWMESLSVVPAGLTKYRKELYHLELFNKQDAAEVIRQVEHWQMVAMENHHCNFIHASDEFYLMAGLPLPEEERYDGYLQLENGVGMVRLLKEEVKEALNQPEFKEQAIKNREISLATGVLAAPVIRDLLESMGKTVSRQVHLYPVENDFFGNTITVAGLLTGRDIVAQLSGKELGSELLLPNCMFRNGEEVFLDDMTRQEMEQLLHVPIRIVASSGQALCEAIWGITPHIQAISHQSYELEELGEEL